MASNIDDKPQLTEHETLAINTKQANLDLLQEDIESDNYEGLSISIVLVYLAMCIGNFCQLFQLVASGAYRIQLTATVGGASTSIWVLQCLAFISTITAPMTAQFADIWGRKWVVVFLSALNCLGVLIVSRANSMTMVIAGQVLSGIGFGAQSLYYAIPSEIIPRQYRPIAQGGINIVIAISGVTSLLGGAVLVQTGPDGWRLLWYILVGLLALTVMLTSFFYNPPPRPQSQKLTSREKLHQLDWIGYALLTIGILFFSMALTWFDNPYPWSNVHVVAPFVVGTVGLIGLGCYNGFFKNDGLFHHALFKKDRNFALALFCIAVEGATFMGANSFFVLEMLVFFETSLLRAALRYCIFFIAMVFGAGFAAIYDSFTKTIRLPTVVSYAMIVLFDGKGLFLSRTI
jgi:MFS family permease